MDSRGKSPLYPVGKGIAVVAGTWLISKGFTAEGAWVMGLGELTDSRVQQWLSDRAERQVTETARGVSERLVDAGVEVTPAAQEALGYLVQGAIPLIANASSEPKRKMMEDVIFNAAQGGRWHATQASASEAIATIARMPDFAALVFAGVVRELRMGTGVDGQDGRRYLPLPVPNEGLPEHLWEEAVEYLRGPNFSERSPYQSAGALLLLNFNESSSQPKGYCLLPRGAWLAQWLLDNPLPPAKEAEEAEVPTPG